MIGLLYYHRNRKPSFSGNPFIHSDEGDVVYVVDIELAKKKRNQFDREETKTDRFKVYFTESVGD